MHTETIREHLDDINGRLETYREMMVILVDEYKVQFRKKNAQIRENPRGFEGQTSGTVLPSIVTPNKKYPENIYQVYRQWKDKRFGGTATLSKPIQGENRSKVNTSPNYSTYSESTFRRYTAPKGWEMNMLLEFEESISPIRLMYAATLKHSKELTKLINKLESE